MTPPVYATARPSAPYAKTYRPVNVNSRGHSASMLNAIRLSFEMYVLRRLLNPDSAPDWETTTEPFIRLFRKIEDLIDVKEEGGKYVWR